MTHICVGKLTIIGSDNGLSPKRHQAIIWTNAGILLIRPLGTNFSEILIEIQTFSLKKIRLKMSSVKCCSFRLGLNVLIGLLIKSQVYRPWISNYIWTILCYIRPRFISLYQQVKMLIPLCFFSQIYLVDICYSIGSFQTCTEMDSKCVSSMVVICSLVGMYVRF